MFHILIFFTVLLIFLHVRKHRITSNDMEVLIQRGALEELYEFKQPILLQINKTEKLLSECNYETIKKNYNHQMIKERGLLALFETDFLRPPLSYPDYSILLTCPNEFEYHISHRRYFIVSQGSVTIQLIPPVFIPSLTKDYYDMKFSYDGEIDLEKMLPVELTIGDCLYIPPLWGYKIIIHEKSSVLSLDYKTPLNLISFGDYYLLHFLQKMNTTYKLKQNKKIEIKTEQMEIKQEIKQEKQNE